MTREFTPYELALKLKQLGFDETCVGYYSLKGKLTETKVFRQDHYTNQSALAPLFQQAFRFFRNNYLYHPHFFSKEDGTFVWCIRWYIDGIQKDTPYFSSNTYEEAELACLDKLIEIIETFKQEQ
jgi:hypothetical protein